MVEDVNFVTQFTLPMEYIFHLSVSMLISAKYSFLVIPVTFVF